jgi:hypothetical protein
VERDAHARAFLGFSFPVAARQYAQAPRKATGPGEERPHLTSNANDAQRLSQSATAGSGAGTMGTAFTSQAPENTPPFDPWFERLRNKPRFVATLDAMKRRADVGG